MPSRAARGVVSVERHTLRLIQMSAAGTYTDALLGITWTPSPRAGPKQGLNGPGGFTQIDHKPVLNDATEFTISLPPVGSDGRDNKQRLYVYADTPDPASPGARTPYFPGDEWVEVYRGNGELVAVGTPINAVATPAALTVTCRCVTHPFKKTRETASGFWQANAPRDVFEYYTRLWQTVVAEDFAGEPATFTYVGCSGVTPAGATAVRIAPGGAGVGSITSVAAAATGAFPQHGAIRAEANLSNISPNPPPGQIVATVYLNLIGTDNIPYTSMALSLLDGTVFAASRLSTLSGAGLVNFPVLASDSGDGATGKLFAPYTLATEVRDRYAYFYLNGQLVAVAPQPNFGSGASVRAQVSFANPGGGTLGGLWVDVDYIVLRHTTRPFNGGQPGTYTLPSPPAPGGITAEYFDLTQLKAYLTVAAGTQLAEATCEVAGAPTIGAKVAESTEMSLCAGFAETVIPSGITVSQTASGQYRIAPCFIRRSGAIWLPLATQDVHFTVSVSGEEFGAGVPGSIKYWPIRLYVGRTRRGEELLAGFNSDPGGFYTASSVTSAGLRATLGNVTGWYPVIFEMCIPVGAWPPDLVLTWDGPGGGQPSPTYLSPLGCYRGQVPDGDSHYDTLVSFTQSFAYQWKSDPKQLESGWFPGAIVPQARVGRDTSFVLDETQAENPQDTIDATDVASTLLGDGAGLGGSSTGQITMEAFDFAGMTKHPFVSQESESLPATNIPGQFTSQLLTLLALRLSGWEDVQASAPGIRQMQDAWPPSVTLPQLKEFDWQPGDSLLVRLPQIGVADTTPRQILALARTLFPDGIGQNTASFRPRPRDFSRTLRRFARQVFAAQRSWQGQLVVKPGTRAMSPAYSEAVLPSDLGLIRQAQLVVLTKDDTTTSFDLEVNGTVVAPQSVLTTGIIDLRAYVGRNFNPDVLSLTAAGVPEPRMLVRLVNPSGSCNASYQVELTVLVRDS